MRLASQISGDETTSFYRTHPKQRGNNYINNNSTLNKKPPANPMPLPQKID